jgi:hypothetical protein
MHFCQKEIRRHFIQKLLHYALLAKLQALLLRLLRVYVLILVLLFLKLNLQHVYCWWSFDCIRTHLYLIY